MAIAAIATEPTPATMTTTAMECLVFGRSEATPPCDTECDPAGIDADEAGMCDRFGRIAPENVIVTYSHTGLGFAGRPGGPVPTVTLQLTGLQFEFLALGRLAGPAAHHHAALHRDHDRRGPEPPGAVGGDGPDPI